jgi:hypothetical protein
LSKTTPNEAPASFTPPARELARNPDGGPKNRETLSSDQRTKTKMNSIQTPSLPGGKKRFLFPFLVCSLAFTSVAFGGANLISFLWPGTFHPYTNNPGSAILEAEWLVHPNGLPPGSNGVPNPQDFYLTATTPHQVNGGEILFRYWPGGPPYFGLFPFAYQSLNDPAMAPYIGTHFILGENRPVMRYRLSNSRTAGLQRPIDLVCTNHTAAITGASSGATLPQSTIYVSGTYNFPSPGKIQIITSTGSPTISYTGTMSTGTGGTSVFTGCTGGSGTMAAGATVAELSGNKSGAVHFQNTVFLFNYEMYAWDVWYDNQFDQTAMLHDCTACGNVCGYWGPMFESNFNCLPGVLPPTGVLDMLVSVDGGPFVQGNTSNAIFFNNLNGCNPSNPYYVLLSMLPNYQWIIQSVASH